MAMANAAGLMKAPKRARGCNVQWSESLTQECEYVSAGCRRIPLLEYLQRHHWTGHRARSEFVGLCPLHEETHPSFYVNPRKNLFYCPVFGVYHGNTITFQVQGADGKTSDRDVIRLFLHIHFLP